MNSGISHFLSKRGTNSSLCQLPQLSLSIQYSYFSRSFIKGYHFGWCLCNQSQVYSSSYRCCTFVTSSYIQGKSLGIREPLSQVKSCDENCCYLQGCGANLSTLEKTYPFSYIALRFHANPVHLLHNHYYLTHISYFQMMPPTHYMITGIPH